MLTWIKRMLAAWVASPLPVPAPVREEMRISDLALAAASGASVPPMQPFTIPKPPPYMAKAMAMDASVAENVGAMHAWAASGAFSEGLGFLGYPYLSELAQRPEYRRITEIIAGEATRKWIKLGGDAGRVKELEAELEKFDIRARFRELAEHDGFFGRGQLFIDLGHPANSEELGKPLLIRKEKIPKGKVRNFKVIEPLWSYPGTYESTSPIAQDFYRPRYWYVMQSIVHTDRLLTIVGRDVPDLLKPVYAFGGLSLSQMAKPYVDNWLRTRQSVSDTVHSYSTPVLATDLSTVLAGGSAQGLIQRADLFNRTRDNRGLMMVNKDSEEFSNVSTPLSSVDKLQAQAQEQIASVTGIPLVILLGVTPSGLNASSDGEIKTFYATIKAYQERVFAGPLKTVLDVLQLNLWGAIDPEITFEFLDLWEMDETDKAAVRKSDSDMDNGYITSGVVSPDEVRERISKDETSPYFGMDLSAPAPEAPDDADVLGGPDPDDGGDPPAQDAAWEESKHKRADNGQFGSGGGGAAPKSEERAPTTAKGKAAQRTAAGRKLDRDAAEAARAKAVETVTKTLPAPGELPPSGEVRQPFKSWNEAAAMAEVGQRQLTELLGKVASRMGLVTDKIPENLTPETKGNFLMIGPIKKEEKAMDKVTTDYGGDVSQLKDLCRATIACDSVEGMAKAVEEAKAAGLKFIAEPKNNYANPKSPVGYRDVNTLVQLPNGMIAELQFNTVAMVAAKEKAHGAYNKTIKIAQELERKPPPDGTWPADVAKRYNELEDFQRREYGAAWERALPSAA